MSTTPMHRPFLVGTDSLGPDSVGQNPTAGPGVARQEFTGLNLVTRNLANQNLAAHDLAGRDMVYGGLHLVPATGNSKKMFANPFQNNYKIAAIAAALFLVLTVV